MYSTLFLKEWGAHSFSPSVRWGKRVWGTFSNLHRTEGEKECSTLSLPICIVGKKSVGYTLSSARWGEEWGAHFFSLEGIAVESQKLNT